LAAHGAFVGGGFVVEFGIVGGEMGWWAVGLRFVDLRDLVETATVTTV
jgi:hypothetical protein